MALTDVLSPYFDADGLRSTNFFNGRLLTGDDLRQEQAASQEHRRRLGRAAGDGIAHGFTVTVKGGPGSSSALAPTLTVDAGLAINREGDTLSLASPVDVSLLKAAKTDTSVIPSTSGGFGVCQPIPKGAYVTGTGVYLLTVCPAQGTEGRAPTNTLGNQTLDRCGAKSNVEGLQFRAINLDQADLLADPMLRNKLAYRCFGTPEIDFAKNPFGPPPTGYGIVDELRRNQQIVDSEVPLAVFNWINDGGIVFVDMWSVRRRIVTPPPATTESVVSALPNDLLRAVENDRGRAEGEARMLQFQEHLAGLRTNQSSGFAAPSVFQYLPAAGIVPLHARTNDLGFDLGTFLSGQTVRGPIYLEGARVQPLLRSSLQYPPIDLRQKDFLIWVYLVRENAQAGQSTQPCFVFASGQIPFAGDAHYNVAVWGYSSFAPDPASR